MPNIDKITLKGTDYTIVDSAVPSWAKNSTKPLLSIIIPNTVTSIGSSAFYNCYSIKSVIIPNGVTSIGDSTFYSCYSLQSVIIPSSVTSIGTYAFYKHYNIIIERTTPPTLAGSSNSLGGTSYTFPIYVPDSAVETYKSTYTSYASRIKGISEMSSVVTVNMTSSTSDMIGIGGRDFDLTEQVDLQILSNVMNAFSNGQTVIFKFTDNKDLVLEHANVDTVQSGYVSLSSSGNSKVETCFSNVLTNVYNTEIYLDNSNGTIDIVVNGD